MDLLENLHGTEHASNEAVIEYLYAITGELYSFAYIKFGNGHKYQLMDASGIPKHNFLKSNPTVKNVPNGDFFSWYLSVRTGHLYFETKEMCILYFLKYWFEWKRLGSPSYGDKE